MLTKPSPKKTHRASKRGGGSQESFVDVFLGGLRKTQGITPPRPLLFIYGVITAAVSNRFLHTRRAPSPQTHTQHRARTQQTRTHTHNKPQSTKSHSAPESQLLGAARALCSLAVLLLAGDWRGCVCCWWAACLLLVSCVCAADDDELRGMMGAALAAGVCGCAVCCLAVLRLTDWC